MDKKTQPPKSSPRWPAKDDEVVNYRPSSYYKKNGINWTVVAVGLFICLAIYAVAHFGTQQFAALNSNVINSETKLSDVEQNVDLGAKESYGLNDVADLTVLEMEIIRVEKLDEKMADNHQVSECKGVDFSKISDPRVEQCTLEDRWSQGPDVIAFYTPYNAVMRIKNKSTQDYKFMNSWIHIDDKNSQFDLDYPIPDKFKPLVNFKETVYVNPDTSIEFNHPFKLEEGRSTVAIHVKPFSDIELRFDVSVPRN